MIKNLPYNPDLRERARWLRNNATLSEILMWNQLKNKQFFGLDFDRQKIIGNYIVDIYCPYLELIIEIDGKSHDWKGKYDLDRNNYLIELGLKILHVNDKEVKQKIEDVLWRLKAVKERLEAGDAPPADSVEWLC